MLQFFITFAVLTVLVLVCEGRFCMLRDQSTAKPQPYSWARVQLAWWSVIILSSFISIFLTKNYQLPDLDPSTLILLGISSATILTARMVDISDATTTLPRHQDTNGENFVLDILSDNNGPSVHRFQTIVFNLAFGCWYIVSVINNIDSSTVAIDKIIPDIPNNNLILLGLSNATYAAMKTTENKPSGSSAPIQVPDAPEPVEPAVG